jgi:hypothetical protein
LDIEVRKNGDHDKDRQRHPEGQLQAYFAIEHRSPLKTPIDASLCVFSPVSKDIGSSKRTAPKNTIRAGIRDLSSQRYSHR